MFGSEFFFLESHKCYCKKSENGDVKNLKAAINIKACQLIIP